jgi:hypothetical protein
MENKPKVKINKRNAAFVELKDFCLFSMAERKDKGDFLEVTEWSNGEGYDIHIDDVGGEKKFHITWGQWDALKKCIKAIEKSYENKIKTPIHKHDRYTSAEAKMIKTK